ncbi:DUF799 domain-containing protein [Uliginosibacterium sp. 31-12]|uniref:DUF799 domain-containing protein n=1 Tax=Uliginosibacterium sp. 31-12 TaxID=3062781 RepID=UPI0026E1D3BE|nr:DUF799 domain-containing protein [Uliginosibacterium sp. 31-12]MDO6386454.1 DUF799 domain-containing protein [Uliginosibacterium sp. 31-12]
MIRILKLVPLLALAALATGCATSPQAYDYAAFRRAQPRSILVLPPVNKSPDIKASNSVMSYVSYPLAESGYYVYPVTVVDETFRQNGLTQPDEIHAVAPAKLHEIFGADTVMYIEITDYGTRYQIFSSDTRVTCSGRLVDLRSGDTLWIGSATASTNEDQGNSGNGVIGMLVKAAVDQIVNTLSDQGHRVAGVTSQRLLAARPNGILYGPRSPRYALDAAPK